MLFSERNASSPEANGQGNFSGKGRSVEENGEMEERHELQTLRNRRTSIEASRWFPIVDNSSGGSSLQFTILLSIVLYALCLTCMEKPTTNVERKKQKSPFFKICSFH